MWGRAELKDLWGNRGTVGGQGSEQSTGRGGMELLRKSSENARKQSMSFGGF